MRADSSDNRHQTLTVLFAANSVRKSSNSNRNSNNNNNNLSGSRCVVMLASLASSQVVE